MVALFGAFQPVSNRVADEMNERIRYLLDDVVVEFGLGAGKREFHFLIGSFGGVTRGAREARV